MRRTESELIGGEANGLVMESRRAEWKREGMAVYSYVTSKQKGGGAMPKLQRSEQDEKSAVLLGIIRKYQEISGMSNKRFAERLGVSTSTLYSKLQKPNRLTWDDMFEMFKILKVPPDEVAECFPGKVRDVTVKVVMTDLSGRRVASVYQ